MRISDWSSDVCSSDLRGAKAAGVATIYQHIPLVPTLSALENILLDEGGWRRRRADARARIVALVASLGTPFPPDTPVGELPIGARQLVAITQALASGAAIVVMDEPTAEIGRATCRERVCQDVWITVVAVALNKK